MVNLAICAVTNNRGYALAGPGMHVRRCCGTYQTVREPVGLYEIGTSRIVIADTNAVIYQYYTGWMERKDKRLKR